MLASGRCSVGLGVYSTVIATREKINSDQVCELLCHQVDSVNKAKWHIQRTHKLIMCSAEPASPPGSLGGHDVSQVLSPLELPRRIM
jgi:hypothetical protein